MNADCDGEFVVRPESVARYSQDASNVAGAESNEVVGGSLKDASHPGGSRPAPGRTARLAMTEQLVRAAQGLGDDGRAERADVELDAADYGDDTDDAEIDGDETDDDIDGDEIDGDTSALDAAVPAVSRKTAKPRVRTRRTRMRSKTIALKRLTRAELLRGALANPPVEDIDRPLTRAECKDMPRPCPFVSCKHHLYLDINPRTGSIKINFPDLEPWELQHTCALDVADNGGLTLEEIGIITNLTRERVRQVEVRGLLTLQGRSRALR